MSIKKRIDSRGKTHYHAYVYDNVAKRQVYVGTFDRRKDAEQAEGEMKRRIRLGEPLKPKEQITFDALSKRWLAGLTSVRPATKIDYDKAMRRLRPFFGHMFVSTITRREIDAAIASLSAHYSPSTTRKTITVFKSMLRVAVDWGYLDSLPTGATKLPLPKIRKRTWKPLSRREVDRLLECAPEYWRPFYLFLLTTGTRRAEAWGVTAADLDLDAGTVHIRRQLVKRKLVDLKSDAAYRRIPLPRQTVEALRAHMKLRPANELDLVFPTPEGKPVDPPNFYVRVHIKTREAARLPHLRLHDLRHQYASTAIMLGRSVKYVQVTLGHANASVTLNTYSWLFPDEGSAAIADLEDWLSMEARGSYAGLTAPILGEYCRVVREKSKWSNGDPDTGAYGRTGGRRLQGPRITSPSRDLGHAKCPVGGGGQDLLCARGGLRMSHLGTARPFALDGFVPHDGARQRRFGDRSQGRSVDLLHAQA